MTETVNYINFEKCKMPKRDEAMKIRKKNAEEHIHKFDFTTMLDIVAALSLLILNALNGWVL